MRKVRGQPSVMKNFSQTPSANIPRSAFQRNRTHKTTMDASFLVPLYLDEVVPGDTHSVNMQVFARLATPITPIMDNLFMDVHFFFVPNRLVWDNWARFLGEQDSPGDSTDYLIPQVTIPGGSLPRLVDYFGLPPSDNDYTVSALPFRGYGLIFNEWYRDQNLVQPVNIPKGDGPEVAGTYPIQFRNKRHDYFTSCLPWPQKGPGVDLPLGTFAPVVAESSIATGETMALPIEGVDPQTEYAYLVDPNEVPGTDPIEWWRSPNDLPPGQGLLADLSDATAATINDLRQAFQIQKLQERDARGGTRLQEIVLAHFGVRGGDARLQRPEYLGGGTFPVGITQVPQTQATGETGTPQGNLAAYGTINGRAGFTKSFVEHGYVFGIASVRADLTYQQGIDRHWSRETKYDLYWPALAHIGEQAVKSKEIYVDGTAADEDVFGYQERYAELRFGKSIISGAFRSSDAAGLDVWHLSQDFEERPVLNQTFIREAPPVDRVIAVPTEPHFLVDTFVRCRSVRPMPVYGTPGYIDHF